MIKRSDYPKEIEVAEGIFYKVKFVRNLEANGYMGLCCFDIKEIWISCGLEPKERLDTFIHEALHAISYENDVPITHKMIYQLEGPLAFLMSRNAVWIKWLE